MRHLILILLAGFLVGCSLPDSGTRTHSKEVGEVKVELDLSNNQGEININPDFKLDKLVGDADVKTENTAQGTTSVNPNLAYSMEGAQALVGKARDLASKWIKPITTVTDNSVRELFKGLPKPTPADDVTTTVPGDQESKYATSEIESLQDYKDRSFSWLSKTGADYGGPISIAFPDCDLAFDIPDAAVSHAPDGNVSNHNQFIYFCGTDFEPGTSENNGGRASVFTPPGCKAKEAVISYGAR